MDSLKKKKKKEFILFFNHSTFDLEYFQIPKIAKILENYPKIDKVFYWERDSGEDIVAYMEKCLMESSVLVNSNVNWVQLVVNQQNVIFFLHLLDFILSIY